MLVDTERVLLLLKHRLLDKRSWGQDELFREIAKLEVESVLDGDAPDPADLVPPGEANEGPLPEDRPEGRPEAMPGSDTPLLAGGARNGDDRDRERERRRQPAGSR